MSTNGREDLLAAYGRFYGEQHFAVAFTASTTGEDAKRVTTREWDKTAPLADADYGAAYVTGRGATRNPVIVLRPSNLIVLECDTDEDLARIDSLALPRTLTVRSSLPYKRHYYFRPPAELEALPYVAFRFESGKLTADSGRYFLAPPSVHPTGAVYGFLPGLGPGEVDLAELPERVYRELAQQAQRESSELRQRIEIDPEAKIRAGNRRDLIFRYACMLRRWGLSEPEIVQSAHAFNEQRCDPPVERHHVEIQVAGAMKKLGGQELASLPADPGPEEDLDPWEPLNLATLPEKPPVQPTLGGIGLVYPGKRHVFSGPQESMKTMVAYAIGLSVVREDGRLILIDFEMGAWDARTRMRELGATDKDLGCVLYIEPSEPADDATMRRLLRYDPTLVIVDAAAGAYDLQGLDDNKRSDVERFTRLYVRAFWKAGVATIVLDHVVKNTELRGRYTIGSERKVGGADVHLGFDVIAPISRGTAGHYKISTHKDRGGFLQRGRLADLELESDPQTHKIAWKLVRSDPSDSHEPFRPTELMEKVSRFLEVQFEAVSKRAIETGVQGQGKYVRQAIDALVREGFAHLNPGPRNSQQITSLRPYRKNDPDHNPENDASSSSSSQFVSSASRRSQLDLVSSSPPLQGDEERDALETNTSSSPQDDPDWDIPF